MSSFYDKNYVLVNESDKVQMWIAPIVCNLKEKEGSERVYDFALKKWVYIPNDKFSWNSYLIRIGNLKLSPNQKLDESGNITNKTELELVDVYSIEESKELLIKKVNSLASSKIIEGFNSDALGSEHKYQSDEYDQLNLIGATTAGIQVYYKCKETNSNDYEYKIHTNSQIKSVLKDGLERKTFILKNADLLKNQIRSAIDKDSLKSININSGWE